MQPHEVVVRYVAEILNGAGPARPEDLVSSVALRQATSGWRHAFPDLQVATLLVVAESDLVACHFSGHGTHRGLFQGAPPTGRPWEARCTAVYRVREDRIDQAWVNWDLLTIMEQLGAVERVRTVSA